PSPTSARKLNLHAAYRPNRYSSSWKKIRCTSIWDKWTDQGDSFSRGSQTPAKRSSFHPPLSAPRLGCYNAPAPRPSRDHWAMGRPTKSEDRRRPMRPYGLALILLLLAGVSAPAQGTPRASPPPAAQPAPATQPAALDLHLQRWEQKMTELRSLSCAIKRIDKDKVADVVTNLVGTALYMKDGKGAATEHRAVLELRYERNKELAEKVIITGTHIYQFSPAAKEIKVFDLPKPKPGQVGDDNVLSFLFGMKAENAKKRYDLALTPDKVSDPYYVYIDVKPLQQADRDEFLRARIVLNRDS